LFNNKDVFA
jgi:hypothetical protein